MDAEARLSGKYYVVALVGPAGTVPAVPGAAEVVRTTSGYEAAAELLAAPAAALLLDLGRITPPHVGLLDLADTLGVPVLAFGTVSATLSGAALSGIRLVGREDIADALGQILSTPVSPEPAETPAPADRVGREEPPTEPAPAPARLTPAKASERTPPPEEVPVDTSRPAGPPEPTTAPRPAKTLTQAELDALLEENP